MDKLEAIRWLKSIKDKYIHGGDENYDSKRAEAIDCAIAALSETVKTNADRIRAMIDTDEKLAKAIIDYGIDERIDFYKELSGCVEWDYDAAKSDMDCKRCLIEWLKQPAEVESDGKS